MQSVVTRRVNLFQDSARIPLLVTTVMYRRCHGMPKGTAVLVRLYYIQNGIITHNTTIEAEVLQPATAVAVPATNRYFEVPGNKKLR